MSKETTTMHAREYEAALNAFRESLRLNPDDKETKYDYVLTKRIVDQKRQQQQNQQNQDNNQQQDNQQDNQQNNQNNQNQNQDQEQKQNPDQNQDNKPQNDKNQEGEGPGYYRP